MKKYDLNGIERERERGLVIVFAIAMPYTLYSYLDFYLSDDVSILITLIVIAYFINQKLKEEKN